LTSANTSVSVSGNMAFNCLGLPVGTLCNGSLVSLDATNATLSDITNPGQSFQVSNCGSPCNVINTNGMSGASYTTSATAPATATGSAAPTPWVPAPVGGALQTGCSQSGATFTCNPGEYTSQLVLSKAGATYNFQPGNYTFDNGLIASKNNEKIFGIGVFFYVSGGQFAISDPVAAGKGNTFGTTFQLTAPTTGAYAGISLYQAPSDASSIVMWAPSGGAAAPVVGGAVEAPGAAMLISSDSKSLSLGFLVAQSLSVSSVAVANKPSPCSSTQLCAVNITG
jgi:hypothetical protein